MTPSELKSITPFDSVTQKTECEIVALNIVKILARTCNEFRKISWWEYSKERIKDDEFNEKKTFTTHEKYYFEKVINYFESEEEIRKFSKSWDI